MTSNSPVDSAHIYGKIRIVDDPDSGETFDGRSQGQRDADRILYSSYFRRLSGITQVVSPQDGVVLHDRLMHSLKVAQIGRVITQNLEVHVAADGQLLDADVVYAAGLAHDLGHPPFGHAAEEELAAVLSGEKTRDGTTPAGLQMPILRDKFEGNAQSFRICSSLSARKPDEDAGLNLMWRTYAAMSKYPWKCGSHPKAYLSNKWGVYDCDTVIFEQCFAKLATKLPGLVLGGSSIEAQIMDWADDIAYAVHDVEDFFRAGLIPLDRMAVDEKAWHEFTDYAKPKVQKALGDRDVKWDGVAFEDVANALQGSFPTSRYDGTRTSRQALHQYASHQITVLGRGLSVDSGGLVIEPESRIRAELLKKLTWFFVIDRPGMALNQAGQRNVIRALFFDLYEMVRHRFDSEARKSIHELPVVLRDYCERVLGTDSLNVYGTEASRLARATVDYICTMTDRQALSLWQRINGPTSGSLDWYAFAGS